MKKGFTIVELIVVIVILAILLLIAVPVYLGINESVNNKIYESKYQELLSKSEIYAEENSKNVFDIKDLIENGLLEPDNELGEYKDPRDDRDMACDVISVIFKDGFNEVTITENNECLSKEELENLYGMVKLKLLDENKNEIKKIEGTEWLQKKKVYITYEFQDTFKEYEKYLEGILWYGESEKTCTKENLEECKYYEVTSNQLLNTRIHFQTMVNINGVIIQNESFIEVLLDNERPKVLEGSIIANNEYNSNNKRKIEFEITDQSGSGISGYSIVKETNGRFTCIGVNYKNASEGIQTEYLDNGNYSICVKDKVGNQTSEEEVNSEKNKFTVDKVNKEGPIFGTNGIQVQRTKEYNNLEPIVTIDVKNSEGNTNGLKMCISLTGFRKDCSWENFTSSKKVKIGDDVAGNYNGTNKTIYVSIQDSYGNVSERSKIYTIYKICSQKTEFKETSNTSSSCPACGKAYYNSNQENYDQYFMNYVCDKKTESQKCNIPEDCCSKKYISGYGPWKSCSVTCGGGIQRRDVYYKSDYNNQDCGTVIDGSSQQCNTQSCDTTPPTINVTKSSSWVPKDTVRATISDPSNVVGYVWQTSATPPSSGWISANSSSISISKEFTSNQTIYLCAKDGVGNKGCQAVKIDKVDNTSPTISSVTGNPSAWTNGNVTLKVNASDNLSGLNSQAAYSFDNGVTWQKESSKTYTGNTNNIIIKVKDNVGNITTYPTIHITKIDKTAPTAKMTVTPGVKSIKIDASGSKDVESRIKTYYFSVDGGANWKTSTNSTYNFVNLTSSLYLVQVKVVDQAGNVSDVVSEMITPLSDHPTATKMTGDIPPAPTYANKMVYVPLNSSQFVGIQYRGCNADDKS